MLNDDDIFKARIKIVEESLKSENGLFQVNQDFYFNF